MQNTGTADCREQFLLFSSGLVSLNTDLITQLQLHKHSNVANLKITFFFFFFARCLVQTEMCWASRGLLRAPRSLAHISVWVIAIVRLVSSDVIRRDLMRFSSAHKYPCERGGSKHPFNGAEACPRFDFWQVSTCPGWCQHCQTATTNRWLRETVSMVSHGWAGFSPVSVSWRELALAGSFDMSSSTCRLEQLLRSKVTAALPEPDQWGQERWCFVCREAARCSSPRCGMHRKSLAE